MNKRIIEKNKEHKFRKVVKYYYPNGDKFSDSAFVFYFISFIFYILYSLVTLITFPISYFWSDYKGKRKVYFIEKTPRRGR
jgi:hypothetical protein